MYNLAIIGGGPAGYTAAAQMSKCGKKVVLFEKDTLGGTCLNVGCIPTKTLLYSAKQYYNALHADKYGVQADNVHFDYAKIQQRKTKVIRKLVAGIKQKCSNDYCEVVKGAASVLPEKRGDAFIIECNDVQYEAEYLLICTGSDNFVPPIPGIKDNPNVWDSTTALAANELPSSIVIVGGGVIGMEFATLFHEFGGEVTVIEAMPSILPNLDKEIVAQLKALYEKNGIRILTDTKVLEIKDKLVVTSQGEIMADRILVSVGRRSHLEGLEGLTGLKVERGIPVDDYMQTNLPKVYAAGDVTGKIMLAHVASKQAEVAVEHILNPQKAEKMNYDAVPSVVYTNPEIASVGRQLTGKEDDGDTYQSISIPMTFSGRFVAENEGFNGLCKVVINRNNDVIEGVHLLGNPSSEFICAASIAVTKKLTLEQFRRIIFPHPTVSEILKEC